MVKRLQPFDAIAFGPGPGDIVIRRQPPSEITRLVRRTRWHHWIAQVVLALGSLAGAALALVFGLAIGAGTAAVRASRRNAMAIAPDAREALRMLAGSQNGYTESIMLAHGFAIGMLRDLVRDGHATAERRTVRAGRSLIEVKWMTITDAGRRALAS
jgi:hypothetical protein